MGNFWRSILIKSETDLSEGMGTALQTFLPKLDKAINISLITFRSRNFPHILSAEIIAFENRPLSYSRPSPELLSLLLPENEETDELLLREIFNNRFEFHLAQILSNLGLQVALVEHRDSLCCSGYFIFNEGMIEDAELYGSGGSDIYFYVKAKKPGFHRRETASFPNSYPNLITLGLEKFLNRPADLDLLFKEFYGSESTKKRYRLMSKKELLKPIVIE